MVKPAVKGLESTEGEKENGADADAGVVAEGTMAAARKSRRNKRSEKTIQAILAATEEVVLQSGADRLSVLDVCKLAEISRGTFYRYYASQDDLLDAFSRHKRDRFHAALSLATERISDPDERFDAVLRYLDDYLENTRAQRLLVVAPEYAMHWFQRIFVDSVVRFQVVLAPVFDAWDKRLEIEIDRELVCECLIRYVLSEMLVPAGPDRRSLPRRIEKLIKSLITGRVSRF